MRYRITKPARSLGPLMLLAAALFLSGCAQFGEGTPISPAPVGQRPADFGLGPGVQPLSSGPGDKGSPSWSPSGERIAFVVDGYVVEKRTDAVEARRQTTRDFGAERVTWMASGERLAILAEQPSNLGAPSATDGDAPRSVYSTALDDSLSVNKVAEEALAISPTPDGENLLVALRAGSSSSQLALVQKNGVVRTYGSPVEGEITALSLTPDGGRAIVAVRKPDPGQTFEILSFSLSEGSFQNLAKLREDMRIFGAPQWTGNGIYYVAGEQPGSGEDVAPDYSLYRLAPGSERPEPAPGVGEDFVASSLKRDPEGNRLAVVGRRNSSSPINLYVLRPGAGDLVAATTNENMEIKPGSEDLDWSGDGRHVAIVARTMFSDPRVYDVPADALVSDFYNVYEVPVDESSATAT